MQRPNLYQNGTHDTRRGPLPVKGGRTRSVSALTRQDWGRGVGFAPRTGQRTKSGRVRSDAFSTRYKVSSDRLNAGLWIFRPSRSQAG